MSDTHSTAEKGINFISQKNNHAEWELAAQNMFGREVREFIGLNDAQKFPHWRDEGGADFDGEFGQVRRYVIGFPPKIEQTVRSGGFNPQKSRFKLSIFGKIFWQGMKGGGIYATTNPKVALEEYGGNKTAAVVDIATGRLATPDNSNILRLTSKLSEPAYLAALGYSAYNLFSYYAGLVGNTPESIQKSLELMHSAIGISSLLLQSYLFENLKKQLNAHTMVVSPNFVDGYFNSIIGFPKDPNFMLLLNAHRKHDHWLVVSDPKRVKLVDVIHSEDEARKYSGAQNFAPSRVANLKKP